MNDAIVSVIIPVKDGVPFLEEAIENIKAQGMNVEIIVIDDGSQDHTSELAIRLGCKVYRQETSKGPVVAKNIGLGLAKGAFVLFHDHDDRMHDGALRTLLEAFDPDTSAVMAKVQDFHTPGMTDEQKRQYPLKEEPYYGLFTGAVLIRKEAFETIGPFDPNLSAGEMLDWEHRMRLLGLRIKKVDFISTDRRIHLSNFGLTHRQQEYRDYAAVLRARLMATMMHGGERPDPDMDTTTEKR